MVRKAILLATLMSFPLHADNKSCLPPMIISFILGACAGFAATISYLLIVEEKPQECALCHDESDEQKLIDLDCGHVFCRECLENMVDDAIDEEELLLLCCPSCNVFWGERDLFRIATKIQLKKIAAMYSAVLKTYPELALALQDG